MRTIKGPGVFITQSPPSSSVRQFRYRARDAERYARTKRVRKSLRRVEAGGVRKNVSLHSQYFDTGYGKMYTSDVRAYPLFPDVTVPILPHTTGRMVFEVRR
jgi:hypothetical protein